MRGLEITFREETITVSSEFHAGVFMYQRNGYFHLVVSGLEEKEKDPISHIWIDSEMEIGETLGITVKDIKESSKPITKKIAFSDSPQLTEKEFEDMLLEKLDIYRTLERLLKDEGLLSE